MLRILSRRNADELIAYHQDDLLAEDEVGPDGKSEVAWFGQATACFGLMGKVRHLAFRRLCRNQDPRTGVKLTARNSRKRRVAFDCVFSAPKSVSIMALLMDDARVTEAHVEAVKDAMAEMEKVARTRVRCKGTDSDRVTSNLVGASFKHFLSREGDPQLHTHKVVFNVTWDAEETKWKALQPAEFYARSRFFTALYRHCLMAKLHRLGYETRRTAKGLEIKDVPKEVIRIFSKRHNDIDRREAEHGSSGNLRLRAGIAQRCRRPKDKGIRNLEGLRRDWKTQLSLEQWTQLERVKTAANQPVHQKRLSAGRAIRLAAEHLFERQSSVRPHAMLAEALTIAEGSLDLAALELALASDQRLHHNGDFVFSTKETMNLCKLFWSVQGGIGQASPLCTAVAPPSDLDAEQQRALRSLLGCRDRFMQLRGPAGSGKTRLLQELARQVHLAGKPVVALAPTTAAVRVLRDHQLGETMTLQRFLRVDQRRGQVPGSVFIVDEAGQISTAQMHALFQAAQNLSARVILVGDTHQHGSVEAGDALRFLEQQTRLHRVELPTVRRQTTATYRRVVERLRDGAVEDGFRALENLGWVQEIIEDELRYGQVARHFVDCVRSKRSSLVVCATWCEINLVSDHIRRGLKDAGSLAFEDNLVESLVPLNFTVAQRQQLHCYEPGQVIVFRAKKGGFIPGYRFTVVEIDGSRLIVRTPHGQEVPLNPRRCAKAFSIFTPCQIALAVGDQVLILENHQFRDPGRADLCNGDLATVARVESAGDIFLTDGRMIPAYFRHFTHGYALTSQRAQSQTVDEVLVAIDAQAGFCPATAETLYVGVSRGRKRCTIYTDDKELLLRAFSRSGERPGAFDLTTVPKR